MSRRNLPETGDLVLGTIIKIQSHGCYIRLDEYEDLVAYCHISELSSTWVRNIRNVVREGKKVVGRVQRVKGTQIDVSLKRVPDSLRRSKMEEWKHYRTALTLLELAAKQRKIDFEIARNEVEDPCTAFYHNFYQAFEEALFKNEQAFTDAGVSEDWAKILVEIAHKNLSIPTKEIQKDIELICWESNGITVIKEALKRALSAREEFDDVEDSELNIDIYTVGAPHYRLVIKARDVKVGEDLLSKALENAESYLENYNANFTVSDVS
ncbi:MAG: translation initiation factor IF-2 subunit alpha [Candidatus Heimdallarchaeaceae archaeon]